MGHAFVKAANQAHALGVAALAVEEEAFEGGIAAGQHDELDAERHDRVECGGEEVEALLRGHPGDHADHR
jgi:hypothetical protein